MLDKDKAKLSVTDADKAKLSVTDADKAIVFAEREGFRALELDLYRDLGSRAASAPLIVFVHGGGWRIGHRRAPRETRDWSDGFFERICAAGFVVAAVSYRFSGEAKFPAQLDDVVDTRAPRELDCARRPVRRRLVVDRLEGAELPRAHGLLVALRGGDHARPGQERQLQSEDRDAARAHDQDGLPRAQATLVDERMPGGDGRARQGRGLLVAQVLRDPDEAVLVQDDMVGE
jgi:hypothetical protein